MQTANYFVFECYSGQVQLFASYGQLGTDQSPIPLSDPDLKRIQKDAAAKGVTLSYYFVASGLEKRAAINHLQQLNETIPQSADFSIEEPLANNSFARNVDWLPTCGSRLTQDHAGRRRDA